jgi:hypothetical protein
LYLTHFKIQFAELKTAGKPTFHLVRSGSNHNVITTQLQTIENKDIIQHVLEMKNLYLRTSHLHQPEYLVVDMMMNLALQKKNILYLSQYDSAQIKDISNQKWSKLVSSPFGRSIRTNPRTGGSWSASIVSSND